MADTISRNDIRQSNAIQRAEEQAALGCRPYLLSANVNERGILEETWSVASRTNEGHEYGVWLREMPLTGHIGGGCDCLAGQAGQACWHVAAATLAHQDAIPMENLIGYRLRIKRQQPAVSAAMLAGKA